MRATTVNRALISFVKPERFSSEQTGMESIALEIDVYAPKVGLARARDLAGALGICDPWAGRGRACKTIGARVQPEYERTTAPNAEDLIAWLEAVAKRQDRDAFARLHRHFAPRLAVWLARAGMAQTQIEDVIQECMLTVWRKAKLFDPSAAGVSTWVFVIARNLRVDHARRRANRDMLPLVDWDEIDDQPDGESRMIAAQDESRVQQALAQLSEDQKQVLTQAYFAEKPQSAIARDLGVPLGTVKSRVRLALARLRTLLEDQA
jgi:RNA polymerase sigma-70 factor (ECF subfamily)